MIRYTLLLLITFFACSCQSPDRENDGKDEEASLREDALEDSIHKALENVPYSYTDSLRLVRGASGQKLLNRLNFEDSMRSLYEAIDLPAYGLEYKVFRHAMVGFYGLQQDSVLSERNLISIIDFTKSSCDKRFYTLDLDNQNVLYHTLVSHGKNTGGDLAESFSNEVGSNQSSLGFYVTAETYIGSKGYSLRLDGMEEGVNDRMRERAVVMHEADYVSEDWVKTYGRIGRSFGCPALPKNVSKKVINTIKDRTAIFAYFDDSNYLKASNFLNFEKLMDRFEEG